MRKLLVRLFKLAFIASWLIVFLNMSLWATTEPISIISSVLSAGRASVLPFVRLSHSGFANEFVANADLSSKYKADIDKLKEAGFIPEALDFDVWILTSDNDNDSDFSLYSSKNKCEIFIGVSKLAKDDSDGITNHHLMHEVAHCVLFQLNNSNKDVDKEKFTDVYGLMMMLYLSKDITKTNKTARKILKKRYSDAFYKQLHLLQNDKYDTAPALVKFVIWLKTIKSISVLPDSKSLFILSIKFSGCEGCEASL